MPDAVPQNISYLQGLANSVADKFSIPQNIFQALITHESSWNVNATGKAGEAGLTQLLPSTAAMLGVSQPYDPVQNLQGGARYLASLFAQFGNWRDALAAYNAGPGNVQAGYGYADTVLGIAGVTNASGPGTQAVPPGTNLQSVVGGSGSANKQTTNPTWWVYGIAIVVILLLLAFGVYGVMKG